MRAPPLGMPQSSGLTVVRRKQLSPHSGSLDEELEHAAEELITGDSDDPPLSEEAVMEMLSVSLNVRTLGKI